MIIIWRENISSKNEWRDMIETKLGLLIAIAQSWALKNTDDLHE